MQTRMYYGFVNAAKQPVPIRDLIDAAIDACRERNPHATPDVLMLNPVHLATLGTTIHARGQRWMGSYNGLIGPREVRVGPV